LLTAVCKNYSADFHRIHWKSGTWAMEETIGLRW